MRFLFWIWLAGDWFLFSYRYSGVTRDPFVAELGPALMGALGLGNQ